MKQVVVVDEDIDISDPKRGMGTYDEMATRQRYHNHERTERF